mmetsp:Transcript_18782/g.55383  ORF Transcript_18782/g.55383 Transcript_18782/m.55383 type:complete len:242 (+) Transcript_18782:614-1339(+)
MSRPPLVKAPPRFIDVERSSAVARKTVRYSSRHFCADSAGIRTPRDSAQRSKSSAAACSPFAVWTCRAHRSIRSTSAAASFCSSQVRTSATPESGDRWRKTTQSVFSDVSGRRRHERCSCSSSTAGVCPSKARFIRSPGISHASAVCCAVSASQYESSSDSMARGSLSRTAGEMLDDMKARKSSTMILRSSGRSGVSCAPNRCSSLSALLAAEPCAPNGNLHITSVICGTCVKRPGPASSM